MAKHKCFFCSKLIEEGEDEIPYKKNRYAHTVCFQNSMKLLAKDKKEKLDEAAAKKKKKAPKPKAELKDPMSEEDYQEKKRFFDYIRSYYLKDNEDGKLPAKVYVLAEKYIEQYGYTYLSMYKTLVYMREIKCMDLRGDAVGMIPYLSDEAEEYYSDLKNVEECNKDKDISKMYKTSSVVVLPKFQRRNNLIDIESL